MRLLPCGTDALLVEVDDTATVTALFQALQANPPAGLVDLVPAERTLLLTGGRPAQLAQAVRQADQTPAPTTAGGSTVEIPVRYDGPDLADVAAHTGLTVDEVVARHSGAEYVASFCGFAPGFAYLTGLSTELQLPRRATPRERVPAGAVAIAGPYTAVYPSQSPGGWHLIGHTDVNLWDLTRDSPALIAPGMRVRFR